MKKQTTIPQAPVTIQIAIAYLGSIAHKYKSSIPYNNIKTINNCTYSVPQTRAPDIIIPLTKASGIG